MVTSFGTCGWRVSLGSISERGRVTNGEAPLTRRFYALFDKIVLVGFFILHVYIEYADIAIYKLDC